MSSGRPARRQSDRDPTLWREPKRGFCRYSGRPV